ncbi:hypothetical protein NG798_01415 [Ancylothrix sp. C2]|uniref:hypothetical protein n=1 Tax=Ancylothrix sp. D3o TaxID=2953691 RepID=UPI0021BA42AB|nr:hypothetical protein [Ancylothrix sp. D3o]MCT7948438.1 hypothetical protein [Ancylothrix sp. D3o]
MRASLNTLVRALEQSQGEFSLVLVRCNNLDLRNQILESVRTACNFKIQEIVLDPSAKTLYTTIVNELASNYPQALMVVGLESVIARHEVLKAANLVREKFREFPFPVVLWVTNEVLEKLIRHVPDFKNWASISIKFDEPTDFLD